MSTFLPVSYIAESITAWEYMQLSHPFALLQVKAVRSTPVPLRVPPCHANFMVRLTALKWPMNKIGFLYRLSAVVRARLKAVSADGLRIPFRPRPAAFVHTHDTRTFIDNQYTKWIGGECVVFLYAFFGALRRSLIRFAHPFRPKQAELATPLHGPLNTKFTESVYMA